MKRREFITLIGGAAVASPVPGYAQETDRMRRVGLLLGIAENDPEAHTRMKAFQQGLRDLAGSSGAIFASTIVLPPVILIASRLMRRSWLGWRPT